MDEPLGQIDGRFPGDTEEAAALDFGNRLSRHSRGSTPDGNGRKPADRHPARQWARASWRLSLGDPDSRLLFLWLCRDCQAGRQYRRVLHLCRVGPWQDDWRRGRLRCGAGLHGIDHRACGSVWLLWASGRRRARRGRALDRLRLGRDRHHGFHGLPLDRPLVPSLGCPACPGNGGHRLVRCECDPRPGKARAAPCCVRAEDGFLAQALRSD